MKTVALITEYNPFHNGHLHHLQESQRLAGAEVAVAVMSGHFLQRGEPALLDKWTRTRMALAAGVDVVIELPFPWACNSAPTFASGAVQCLDALGGVDALCFGSESGSIIELQAAADLLLEYAGRIKAETAKSLRQGVNYPTARAQVVSALGDQRTAELLSSPNNILGIEYLKALHVSASPIQPLTLERIGAGYHDEQACGEIASATGIRKRLVSGEEVGGYLPQACRQLLADAVATGETADDGLFFHLLLGQLLLGSEELSQIYLVDNGLDQRLFEKARRSSDLEALISETKSRQLTRTRIQRILCYVFNQVRRVEMEELLEAGPLYLHLLGYSQQGQKFLSANRKACRLPMVQNYSRVFSQLKRFYGATTDRYRLAELMVEQEVRVSRLYSLLVRGWAGEDRNRDFYIDVLMP
jgi:predicted nucleotidyltransferase